MNKRDIKALVEGRLSNERKKEVIKWLLKNPKQQQRYHKLKAEHVAQLLKNPQYNGHERAIAKRNRLYKLVGYAALIAILIGSAVFLIQPSREPSVEKVAVLMTTTTIGENKDVVLPDGSQITLNSNTSITYPHSFEEGIREVTLSGEAFFDVTHDEERPFIVHMDNGVKIQVLGTSFNIKSYPEDQNVETTLVSGKVRVVEEKDNKTVVLNPSQRATYVKNEDKIIIDKVETENLTSWRQGKLVYDETPIREVISDLKRKYKVTISVASPEIMNYRYTGVFDNLTIEQILDLFEVSSPILFKKNHTKITLYMNK
ncbi:FecR domain-containing protein [Cytophaga sp. FL35]|uniref:FecR family protein n=1 Tax=Cytophaga sp. FL35 TaxID=1904456 RepID=UPI0016534218|nr:FecR domain-containing protein [Cytophaga sp. FL35]MBC6999420.1 FecR domain-containing protein [Cytophaga sp. FL35]